MTDQPDIMTIEEVSAYLRVPVSSLYKLAQQGKIPASKVGRHWRFRRAFIDQWMDNQIHTSHPSDFQANIKDERASKEP